MTDPISKHLVTKLYHTFNLFSTKVYKITAIPKKSERLIVKFLLASFYKKKSAIEKNHRGNTGCIPHSVPYLEGRGISAQIGSYHLSNCDSSESVKSFRYHDNILKLSTVFTFVL